MTALFSACSTKWNARGTITAPCLARLLYGDSPASDVSVMPTVSRVTLSEPVTPYPTLHTTGQRLTGCVRVAPPPDEQRPRKPAWGRMCSAPVFPRSQAGLNVKSTAKTAPPRIGRHRPARHLAYWPVCRALCGMTIPMTPPSFSIQIDAARVETAPQHPGASRSARPARCHTCPCSAAQGSSLKTLIVWL